MAVAILLPTSFVGAPVHAHAKGRSESLQASPIAKLRQQRWVAPDTQAVAPPVGPGGASSPDEQPKDATTAAEAPMGLNRKQHRPAALR